MKTTGGPIRATRDTNKTTEDHNKNRSSKTLIIMFSLDEDIPESDAESLDQLLDRHENIRKITKPIYTPPRTIDTNEVNKYGFAMMPTLPELPTIRLKEEDTHWYIPEDRITTETLTRTRSKTEDTTDRRTPSPPPSLPPTPAPTRRTPTTLQIEADRIRTPTPRIRQRIQLNTQGRRQLFRDRLIFATLLAHTIVLVIIITILPQTRASQTMTNEVETIRPDNPGPGDPPDCYTNEDERPSRKVYEDCWREDKHRKDQIAYAGHHCPITLYDWYMEVWEFVQHNMNKAYRQNSIFQGHIQHDSTKDEADCNPEHLKQKTHYIKFITKANIEPKSKWILTNKETWREEEFMPRLCPNNHFYRHIENLNRELKQNNQLRIQRDDPIEERKNEYIEDPITVPIVPIQDIRRYILPDWGIINNSPYDMNEKVTLYQGYAVTTHDLPQTTPYTTLVRKTIGMADYTKLFNTATVAMDMANRLCQQLHGTGTNKTFWQLHKKLDKRTCSEQNMKNPVIQTPSQLYGITAFMKDENITHMDITETLTRYKVNKKTLEKTTKCKGMKKGMTMFITKNNTYCIGKQEETAWTPVCFKTDIDTHNIMLQTKCRQVATSDSKRYAELMTSYYKMINLFKNTGRRNKRTKRNLPEIKEEEKNSAVTKDKDSENSEKEDKKEGRPSITIELPTFTQGLGYLSPLWTIIRLFKKDATSKHWQRMDKMDEHNAWIAETIYKQIDLVEKRVQTNVDILTQLLKQLDDRMGKQMDMYNILHEITTTFRTTTSWLETDITKLRQGIHHMFTGQDSIFNIITNEELEHTEEQELIDERYTLSRDRTRYSPAIYEDNKEFIVEIAIPLIDTTTRDALTMVTPLVMNGKLPTKGSPEYGIWTRNGKGWRNLNEREYTTCFQQPSTCTRVPVKHDANLPCQLTTTVDTAIFNYKDCNRSRTTTPGIITYQLYKGTLVSTNQPIKVKLACAIPPTIAYNHHELHLGEGRYFATLDIEGTKLLKRHPGCTWTTQRGHRINEDPQIMNIVQLTYGDPAILLDHYLEKFHMVKHTYRGHNVTLVDTLKSWSLDKETETMGNPQRHDTYDKEVGEHLKEIQAYRMDTIRKTEERLKEYREFLEEATDTETSTFGTGLADWFYGITHPFEDIINFTKAILPVIVITIFIMIATKLRSWVK